MCSTVSGSLLGVCCDYTSDLTVCPLILPLSVESGIANAEVKAL